MIAYNKVILSGKVANLPQRRYRLDGSLVVQFPLEMDEVEDLSFKKNGGRNEKLAIKPTGVKNLIDVLAFGKLAELNSDIIQSGKHLLVIGQLRQRNWQTQEGKRRSKTEIIAKKLRSLEGEPPLIRKEILLDKERRRR